MEDEGKHNFAFPCPSPFLIRARNIDHNNLKKNHEIKYLYKEMEDLNMVSRFCF